MCWFFKAPTKDPIIWQHNWHVFKFNQPRHFNGTGVPEERYREESREFEGFELFLERRSRVSATTQKLRIEYKCLQLYSDSTGWNDVPDEVKRLVYKWLDYAWQKHLDAKEEMRRRLEAIRLTTARELLEKAKAPHGFGETKLPEWINK